MQRFGEEATLDSRFGVVVEESFTRSKCYKKEYRSGPQVIPKEGAGAFHRTKKLQAGEPQTRSTRNTQGGS